jgi:uncharacterized protein YjiS (DUF1127 family)
MERTLSSDSLFQVNTPKLPINLPLSVISTLQLWKRRIASRRELAMLDSRMLADAGISYSERDAILRKPFWRG